MIYSNIYYFKRISAIGGTEQFLYEIAKKYNKYDITIFYDSADRFQLRRLRQYLRCRKRVPGEKVICHRAFFNFNIDMIDDVESIDNYYAFVSHAIYQELGYHPPIDHPKLNHFIGVSQYSCDKLKEFAKTIGKDIEVERCYNPLTLEPKEKVIRIVSAGRLDDKTKDNGRTIKLINALDKYATEHNRHYIWTIFSNPISFGISSSNVVLMKPRVDVRPYIAAADFVVQLSNDMETYCYTNQEALGYGVRIITTPLTVNKELGIPEEANLICNWDMSNVDEIARRVFEEEYKKFNYKVPEDSWESIIDRVPNNYINEKEKIMKARVIQNFKDKYTGEDYPVDKVLEITRERFEEILEVGNLVEEIKEEEPIIEKEEKIKEEVKPKKETKKKKK